MEPRVAAALVAVGLAGCASNQENVLFVTSTELGVGFDSTTQAVNVGYDRNEFVTGPAFYTTGAIPNVAGSIRSNLSIFEPTVDQVYATGRAAALVTKQNQQSQQQTVSMTGASRPMIFGTATNAGLKVAFLQGAPSTLNFAYKRREMSIIPVRGSDKDETGAYGSALASIKLGAAAKTVDGTKMEIEQFFATGEAAENLASQANIQQGFRSKTQAAFEAAGKAQAAAAARESSEFVACVAGQNEALTDDQRRKLGQLFDDSGFSGDSDTKSALKAQLSRIPSKAQLEGWAVDHEDVRAKMLAKAKSARATYCAV